MANQKNDAPSKPPELTQNELAAATFTRPPEPELVAPPEPALPPRDAVVITNAEGTLCRPPVGVGIHTLGPVVIGNWVGHIDGKSVTVDHGTPVRGLPKDVLRAVRETPEQKIGLFDARKKAVQRQPGL